jgi:hypothetical protein
MGFARREVSDLVFANYIRIPIKAYNLPALSVVPASMDFATSQPGETRLLVLTLINLLSIDCPCTLFLTSPNSVFQLPQTQYTLLPQTQKRSDISQSSFFPTELKKYSAKIGIIAFGGQVRWYPHKILILRFRFLVSRGVC